MSQRLTCSIRRLSPRFPSETTRMPILPFPTCSQYCQKTHRFRSGMWTISQRTRKYQPGQPKTCQMTSLAWLYPSMTQQWPSAQELTRWAASWRRAQLPERSESTMWEPPEGPRATIRLWRHRKCYPTCCKVKSMSITCMWSRRKAMLWSSTEGSITELLERCQGRRDRSARLPCLLKTEWSSWSRVDATGTWESTTWQKSPRETAALAQPTSNRGLTASWLHQSPHRLKTTSQTKKTSETSCIELECFWWSMQIIWY